jgi:two-component system KDP operon response regulator KdpE
MEANGYRVILANDGAEGLRCAATEHPDIILLDLGLPDKDGADVLRDLRQWSKTPVVILSVRNSEEDVIACLDAGANDYLTKPFRSGELLARVRAAIRLHAIPDGEPVVSFWDVRIDLSARVVTKKGVEIHLTSIEYALLTLLGRNVGRVLTHRTILQEVWGPNQADETQYLRVFVGQLRKKIEDDPSHPRIILTETGIGYRLVGE